MSDFDGKIEMEKFSPSYRLMIKYTELENRIDKAIEYIENHKKPLHHSFDEPDCDYWIATNPDDLLDILKGSDSNE